MLELGESLDVSYDNYEDGAVAWHTLTLRPGPSERMAEPAQPRDLSHGEFPDEIPF